MKYIRKTKSHKLDSKPLNSQKLDKLQQQKIKGGTFPWTDGP